MMADTILKGLTLNALIILNFIACRSPNPRFLPLSKMRYNCTGLITGLEIIT